MPPLSSVRSSLRGFSLMQLAVIVTIISMVAVTMLPGGEANSPAALSEITKQRMLKIEEATKAFMLEKARRPCPADATLDLGSANFGVEAATPGSCSGGTPASNFVGTGGNANAVAGGVPTAALNLPDEYAFDGFGRRITYVVDKRATARNSCYALQGGATPLPASKGDIEIRSAYNVASPLTSQNMWALLSYGRDAHGAFPAEGQGTVGGYSVSNRLNTGNTDNDTLYNAFVDSLFATSFTKGLVKKSPTSTFDDLVWYAEDTKNTCCVGKICPRLGVRFDGHNNNQWFGFSNTVGDFNGDGIKDIAVSSSQNGAVYVIFGRTGGWSYSSIATNANIYNGTNASLINLGHTAKVSAADMNNDGIDDLLISSPDGISVHLSGTVYLIYGRSGAWPGTIDADTDAFYASGTNGVRFDGTVNGEGLHAIVAGNVDGDAWKDIIIGSYNADSNAGRVTVIYGRDPTTWPLTGGQAIISRTDAFLNNGGTALNGFKLIGEAASDGITCCANGNGGSRLASGDYDGDGKDDIVIAASNMNRGAFPNPNGSVYVVYGKSRVSWTSLDNTLDTTFLNGGGTALRGFRLDGEATDLSLGGQGIKADDINGDGKKDIIITSNANKATYIVYGRASGWSATQTLSVALLDNPTTAANGIVITGTDRACGPAYGDFNHDGKKDLILPTASSFAYSGSDSYYILFGDLTTHITVSPTWLNGGSGRGTRLDGENANSGMADSCESNVADMNNDGIDDLISGSFNAHDNGTAVGALYVIYGAKSRYPVGTNIADLLNEPQ